MKRIVSLLMALVLVCGVCVFISSCGEADDTSSSNEANLVQDSKIGEIWQYIMHDGKAGEARAYLCGEADLIISSSLFDDKSLIRRDDLNDIFKYFCELEDHVTEKIDVSDEFYETFSKGRSMLYLKPEDKDSELKIVVMEDDEIYFSYFEDGNRAYEFFKLDKDYKEIVSDITAMFDPEKFDIYKK